MDHLKNTHSPIPEVPSVELVRRFRGKRVLVLGDAMLDTYLEGDATRLCSEGPVPIVHKTAESHIPGGAANVAANLQALGADVLFVSMLGNDSTGRMLREVLKRLRVSDRWLIEHPQAPTLHKLRILAGGQYVVRFDEGAAQDYLNPEAMRACQQRLVQQLELCYQRCELVVISDYRYGVCNDAVLDHLYDLFVEQPKPLVIDSKALQRFRKLPATIVTPNYREACTLVGSPVQPLTALKREELQDVLRPLAQEMLSMLSVEHVAITLGPHGVFVRGRLEQEFFLPAHSVAQAYDVGAGDSFASALALALTAGAPLPTAVQIGLDAASIAVSRPRTAIVQLQELLQRVSVREYTTHARSFGSAYGADHQEAITRLATLLAIERVMGRRIVFTNGVFDILHAGHVQFLRQAKALGDILVVGINSDASVRRLKGPGRPIISERDRMALVAALDMVDHVVLFDEDTPNTLIRALRPDLHVKGGDYADEELPEAEAVQAVGGQIVIVPLIGTVSTSSVIHRIVTLAEQHKLNIEARSQ